MKASYPLRQNTRQYAIKFTNGKTSIEGTLQQFLILALICLQLWGVGEGVGRGYNCGEWGDLQLCNCSHKVVKNSFPISNMQHNKRIKTVIFHINLPEA